MARKVMQGVRASRRVPEFNWVFPADAWEVPGPFPARDYQRRMIEAAWDRFREGSDSAMIVSSTGTGKTVAFGHVCRLWPRSMGRILVLVHRDELLGQALRKIRAICQADIVEAEQGMSEACRGFFGRPGRSRIVVASKDSLCKGRRLKGFRADEFGLIIPDECHHCLPRNRTYWDIIDYFYRAYLLGVTATPDRTDEEALGQAFTSVAYCYPMLDAINDGWLVPVMQQYVQVTDYDLSRVRVGRDGDLSEAEMEIVLRQEKVLQGIASAAVDLSNKRNPWGSARPTLIFAASVQHAKDLADIINRRHYRYGTGSAAVIAHGLMTTDERRDIIARFRRGDVRFLVNMGIATEGFDAPEIRVVVIARPTNSRSLYEQMIGRGTRPAEDIVPRLNRCRTPEERRELIYRSGKPSCLIVDPVGNSGRHKLITLPDVLGGYLDDDVVASAKEAIFSTGERRGDPISELIRARQEKDRIESERRRHVIIDARYSTRVVDPFDIYDVSPGREPGWFKGRPATDGQKAALERSGLTPQEIQDLSFHKASKLIDEVVRRTQQKLCTYGQAKVLARHGYDTNVSFEDASRTIDELAANGWKRP